MLTGLINFDTKTLLGILVWGNAATGVIVYLYHVFNVRKTDRNNIRNMTIIRLLCAVGYLLLYIRGDINDFISVNVGNTILFLSHYLEARLILELANATSKKLNNIITAIFVISIFAFNTLEFCYRDASLRVSVASIIIFAIFLLPTIRIMTEEVSRFKKSIGVFYVFLLCALIPRSIQPFMDKNVTVLSNNYYQTLMFIALILMTVSNTIIYLLFMKEQTDIIIEKNFTLKTLLNALDTYMFVAELDTDRIIFINDKMKEQFHLDECAVGKHCYDVMNPCMNKRCDFCVKRELLKNPHLAESMDAHVEFSGVSYKKSDRIIEWYNGKKVHLQYFIDVSQLKHAESKLETQFSKLERMSALINAAHQSISYVMPDGKFDFFNPATCKLSGYSEEELMEEGTLLFYNDDKTKQYITDEILPAIARNGKHEYELPLIRKDGEERIMKYSAFAIGGYEKGLGYIVTDVTELKQLERELVIAKEKAERIINTAPVAYGLSIGGIVIEANEYAKTHLGMKPGDSAMSFYVNPEERNTILALAGSFSSSGVVSLYLHGGGSHRFFVNFSTFIQGADEARILWAVDIENNELQKDQLKQTQQSLQTVLDFLPIPITIIDVKEGYLIYANKSAEELFGVTLSGEPYGHHVTEFLPELQPDGANSFEKTLTLDSAGPVSIELKCLKPGNETFDALITACIIDYKGRQASINVIQDLTSEKEYQARLKNTAEKEREANRSKSEFLSRMSHEIRTPMNAIIGMTSIAQNSADPQYIKQCLHKIDNASKHLLGVINDILDMSKIEADKFELSYDEFDFYSMFDNLVNMVHFRTESKQQTISVNIDDNVPRYIIGDEQHLSQVITNLLSNATKFTPDDGLIELAIKIIDEQDSVYTIQIEVEDNGIGIPPEQQSNIFNSFEQASGSIARKYGGTGLGLAISKRIVELMNGNIWVESELGSGSKFIFTIKAQSGNGKSIDTNRSNTLPTNNDFSNHRILLAEDVEINSEIIMAILEDTGVTIDAVPNGLEAVRCFQDNPDRYSLILMDINMPEMDGYDATRSIRSLNFEKAKTIPIIAMTADVFKEDIERCLMAGMNSHIGKPVDINELFEKLNLYLLK